MKKNEISLLAGLMFIITLIALVLTWQGQTCADARGEMDLYEKTILLQYDTNCFDYINSPVAELNRQRLETAKAHLLDSQCQETLEELYKIDRSLFCKFTSVPVYFTMPAGFTIIVIVFVALVLFYLHALKNKRNIISSKK